MPGTDIYSQNVSYPKLQDQPNIEAALSATVNAAVPKMNMTFADANARAAAIPKPVEGMETYLVAERRKEIRVQGVWQQIVMTTFPWANVVLTGTYEAFIGSTVGPRVRREGSIVYLEGRMQRKDVGLIPPSEGLVIAQIPTSYRPVGHYAEGFATISNSGNGTPLARIEIWNTDGSVRYYSDRSTQWIGFSSWWFVN
jgi:hypothetical protein